MLSKYPIVSSASYKIKTWTGNSDRNDRIILHAVVDVPVVGKVRLLFCRLLISQVNFYVAHLTYDAGAQCYTMQDLFRFISESRVLDGELNCESSTSYCFLSRRIWTRVPCHRGWRHEHIRGVRVAVGYGASTKEWPCFGQGQSMCYCITIKHL